MIAAFRVHGKPHPACVLASDDVSNRANHSPGVRTTGRPIAGTGRSLRAMRAVPAELPDLSTGPQRGRIAARQDRIDPRLHRWRAATDTCIGCAPGSLPRLPPLRSGVSCRCAVWRIAGRGALSSARAASSRIATARDRMGGRAPCPAGSNARCVPRTVPVAAQAVAATATENPDRWRAVHRRFGNMHINCTHIDGTHFNRASDDIRRGAVSRLRRASL